MAPKSAETSHALLSHKLAIMAKFSAPPEPLPTKADDVLGAKTTL